MDHGAHSKKSPSTRKKRSGKKITAGGDKRKTLTEHERAVKKRAEAAKAKKVESAKGMHGDGNTHEAAKKKAKLSPFGRKSGKHPVTILR